MKIYNENHLQNNERSMKIMENILKIMKKET